MKILFICPHFDQNSGGIGIYATHLASALTKSNLDVYVFTLRDNYFVCFQVSNLSSNQVPSKLIDYSLTKRPVFSFKQNDFDISEFNLYLNGKYSTNNINIKLDNYDINNVCNKFLDLL